MSQRIIVKTDTNLVYDSYHEKCKLFYSGSQGRQYALIQCLDVGDSGKGEHVKRYWGLYDESDKESSIEGILRNGGKWPILPE